MNHSNAFVLLRRRYRAAALLICNTQPVDRAIQIFLHSKGQERKKKNNLNFLPAALGKRTY